MTCRVLKTLYRFHGSAYTFTIIQVVNITILKYKLARGIPKVSDRMAGYAAQLKKMHFHFVWGGGHLIIPPHGIGVGSKELLEWAPKS